MDSKFNQQKVVIRKNIISFLGAKLQIFDGEGQPILYSHMKAFKLKEDIRLYNDESMQQELLAIRARSMIDFSATYDVFDGMKHEKVGAFRRKGMKSLLKDEWIILDTNDREIGLIKEDNMLFALIRRVLPFPNLIPQSYDVEINGRRISTFKQDFNPFVMKLNLDFSLDSTMSFDRRMGIAAGILLCTIEGHQE
mgnify:CR=1 FL=1